jgi:hypothetical protein
MKARQRILTGLAVVLAGAGLFELASAYVVDHDYNKIAAAIVGAFAFPVAPLGWHLFSERRRKKRVAAAKTPTKSSLTGADRYWFRFIVVALAVLGPMFATSGFKVLGAVGRHGAWFVPTSPVTAADTELLRRVPSEAEWVAVVRQKPEDGKPGGTGVAAWAARQAMVAFDGTLDATESIDKQIDELNARRDMVSWLPIDKFARVPTSGKTVLVATDGWRGKVDPPGPGPSQELRDELARAPADAPFVVAIAPRTKITAHDIDAETIRHGVLWVTQTDSALAIAGRLEMRDEAAAAKLLAELDAVVHLKTSDIPERCHDAVGKIVDHVKLEQSGTILTARAEISNDALMGVMFCALK